MLKEDEATRDVLLQVKGLGVKISMDDFGTGHSSLSCLRNFPFDKIKIDQSFIRTMTENNDSAAIVRAIIELSQSLKIKTTAEGVENGELVKVLTAAGCAEGQGYYFGKPVPAETVAQILERDPYEEPQRAAG